MADERLEEDIVVSAAPFRDARAPGAPPFTARFDAIYYTKSALRLEAALGLDPQLYKAHFRNTRACLRLGDLAAAEAPVPRSA